MEAVSSPGSWVISSVMSASPGPEVAVMTRLPTKEAPMPAAREAISSSNWIALPPNLGSSRQRNSKIGVAGVIEVVERLQAAGMLDCLQLLHCHMGSQISDIQVINAGLTELTRVYTELHRLGAGLRYLDVGGGLGVDYDGSATNLPSSMNYTIREYARDVVHRVAAVCDARGLEHPTIVSESGRAIAAYRQHEPPQADLPGHGHIASDVAPGEQAHHGDEHGHSGARAVLGHRAGRYMEMDVVFFIE